MPLYLGEQGAGDGSLYLSHPEEHEKPTLSIRNNRIKKSAEVLLRKLGEMAVYNGYLTVRVIHRESVERFNASGEVVMDDHQVSFLRSAIPFAKRNDVIKIDENQVFVLQSPIDRSDEGLNTWVVN